MLEPDLSRRLSPVEDGEEDDDNIVMSARDVLQKLEETWLNEKFAPELLEGREDLVDCMMDQLSAMETNLTMAQKGDLKISLHRMEVDRIRFIVSDYLRIRLKKIEKFASHALDQQAQRKDDEEPLMSESEIMFAKKFLDCKKGHFGTLALKHMPNNMQKAEKELAGVTPKLNSYVFLRVNESTKNVLIEEDTVDTGEEIMDLEVGDQHILCYKPVASLVNSGAVSLI